MRTTATLAALLGLSLGALTVGAQVQPPPAPWRGAGATPCVASDGGIIQCPASPRTIAVRAGRLFNSTTGQLLMRQVVVIQGDRITDVGAEGQIRIPTGAEVIDLTQSTVLPGLIDAHTHMFNNATARHVAGDGDAHRHPEPAGGPASRVHRGARHELSR